MSALHRIQDIGELDGPTFFALAYRLPAYEGASRTDLEGWLEDAQEAERQAEEAKFPPRYIDSGDMREKEGRVSATPVYEPQRVQREDRAATLDELVAAGPPMPQLGEIAPIFEVARPPVDS